MTVLIAPVGITFAADAAANWNQHCASCHGKDGSGHTMMGKKLASKIIVMRRCRPEFSDAKAAKSIKEGVKRKRQGQDEAV